MLWIDIDSIWSTKFGFKLGWKYGYSLKNGAEYYLGIEPNVPNLFMYRTKSVNKKQNLKKILKTYKLNRQILSILVKCTENTNQNLPSLV